MVERDSLQISNQALGYIYNNSLDIGSFMLMMKDPTCCYKFYWLEALVKLIDENVESTTLDSVINEMIANAWYTVLEFHIHLSGIRNSEITDNLEKAILSLSEKSTLSPSASKLEIKQAINTYNDDIRKYKEQLILNVPYRALAGFFNSYGERANWNITSSVIELINKINNHHPLPYILDSKSKLEKGIFFNPIWKKFIQDNSVSIIGWIQHEKSKWLQLNNPEVPGIVHKLAPLDEKIRKLTKVRKLWDYVLSTTIINDVYSHQPINNAKYDIDHFVPWSFVMNDELWNLSPMNSSLNSSKNNRLPQWEFFKYFSQNQYKLYTAIQNNPKTRELFEKCYCDNLHSIWAEQELYRPGNSEIQFQNILQKNMKPLYDSAKRQGYELWNLKGKL